MAEHDLRVRNPNDDNSVVVNGLKLNVGVPVTCDGLTYLNTGLAEDGMACVRISTAEDMHLLQGPFKLDILDIAGGGSKKWLKENRKEYKGIKVAIRAIRKECACTKSEEGRKAMFKTIKTLKMRLRRLKRYRHLTDEELRLNHLI